LYREVPWLPIVALLRKNERGSIAQMLCIAACILCSRGCVFFIQKAYFSGSCAVDADLAAFLLQVGLLQTGAEQQVF
jgi:hypothetical protein